MAEKMTVIVTPNPVTFVYNSIVCYVNVMILYISYFPAQLTIIMVREVSAPVAEWSNVLKIGFFVIAPMVLGFSPAQCI